LTLAAFSGGVLPGVLGPLQIPGMDGDDDEEKDPTNDDNMDDEGPDNRLGIDGHRYAVPQNNNRPLNVAVVPVFGTGYHSGAVSTFKDPYPPEKHLNKLFRFGEPTEAISSLIVIKDHVFCKIFKGLVEFIIEEGVAVSDIRMMAWLLTNCEGTNHLFVNTPTDTDPMRLMHIANVKHHGRVSDVTKAITKGLAKYPCHYVLQCQFKTTNSLLGSVFMNPHSLERIYNNVNLLRDDEI
jgi:hypothetical protein